MFNLSNLHSSKSVNKSVHPEIYEQYNILKTYLGIQLSD